MIVPSILDESPLMRLRDLSWYQRGKLAFAEGLDPGRDAPFPVNTQQGRDWFRGFTEAREAAKADDQAETLTVIDVAVVVRGGRFRLVDSLGRVLGTQTHVVVEQGDDELTVVTAVFAGVPIKSEPS